MKRALAAAALRVLDAAFVLVALPVLALILALAMLPVLIVAAHTRLVIARDFAGDETAYARALWKGEA